VNRNLLFLKSLFERAFPDHDFNWKETESGRAFKAHCPFHDDKNPSFNVYLGRDGRVRYKCFSCNANGEVSDLINLLKKQGKWNREEEERFFVSSLTGNKEEGESRRENEKADFDPELKSEAEEFLKEAKEELLKVLLKLDLSYLEEEPLHTLKARAEVARDSEKPVWEFLCLLKKVRFTLKSAFNPSYPEGKERIKIAIENFELGVITENLISSLTGKRKLRKKLLNYKIDNKIGAFVFPYFSFSGELLSLKFRRPSHSSRDSRVLKIREGKGYFGVKTIVKEKDSLHSIFSVEGETDALALYLEGLMSTISLGSVSQIKNLVLDPNFKDYFLVYFPDYDPFTFTSLGSGREAVISLFEEREEVEKTRKEKREVFVYCDEKGYGNGKDYCEGDITLRELLSSRKILPLKKAVVEIKNQHRKFLLSKALKYKKQLEENGFDGLGQNVLYFFSFGEKVPVPIKSSELSSEYDYSPLLGIYPQNKISLLAGAGGTGKTLRVLDLCARITISEEKKCLFWTTEHTEEELNAMYLKILKNCYKEYEKTAREKTYFIGQLAEPAVDNRTEKINPSFFLSLEWLLRDYDVIFLDPFLSFYGANENNQHLIRQFLEEVGYVLKFFEENKQKKYLFFLHHTNKKWGEEFRIYIEDYEHTKTTNRFGRTSIFIPPEKAETLRIKIRGGGALLDTVRLVEYLAVASSKPKSKEKKEVEDFPKRYERISFIVKANFPSGGQVGEGEVIPNLLNEKCVKGSQEQEQEQQEEEEGWYNENEEFNEDDFDLSFPDF